MKQLKIYRCPICGNIIVDHGNAKHSCCGMEMTLIPCQEAAGSHLPKIQESDGEWFLEFDHPMEKSHYIAGVVVEHFDRYLTVGLYPEQNPSLRIPVSPASTIHVVCVPEGVFHFRPSLCQK